DLAAVLRLHHPDADIGAPDLEMATRQPDACSELCWWRASYMEPGGRGACLPSARRLPRGGCKATNADEEPVALVGRRHCFRCHTAVGASCKRARHLRLYAHTHRWNSVRCNACHSLPLRSGHICTNAGAAMDLGGAAGWRAGFSPDSGRVQTLDGFA